MAGLAMALLILRMRFNTVVTDMASSRAILLMPHPSVGRLYQL
jgi:hypothetical protein